jgi:hypothetical protein
MSVFILLYYIYFTLSPPYKKKSDTRAYFKKKKKISLRSRALKTHLFRRESVPGRRRIVRRRRREEQREEKRNENTITDDGTRQSRTPHHVDVDSPLVVISEKKKCLQRVLFRERAIITRCCNIREEIKRRKKTRERDARSMSFGFFRSCYSLAHTHKEREREREREKLSITF